MAAIGVWAQAPGHPDVRVLSNGIQLPQEWPPKAEHLSSEPPPVPYLESPPAVVPIDVGRQLFVDDFLLESSTLKRTFHAADLHETPVLRPDKWWEIHGGRGSAMAYSDGVWYDPRDHLYKMWYSSGASGFDGPRHSLTLYATSLDGFHWQKPALDVEPGTNIVLDAPRDAATIWLDLDEQDPARRFKLAYVRPKDEKHFNMYAHVSADGIHWGQALVQSPPAGDRSTFLWNPFRKVWVVSIRRSVSDPTDPPEENVTTLAHSWFRGPTTQYSDKHRARLYVENADFVKAFEWKEDEPVYWTGADRLDPMRVDFDVRPELYNIDAVGYESLMVGLFSIWRGQPDNSGKPNDLVVGFSRDGFHWDRPCRHPFVPVSEDLSKRVNIQSVGGGFLVVGDRLYFYVSGRSGSGPRGWGNGSGEDVTYLATLRRDGFASLDAGEMEATAITRPVKFTGKHMFVNVDDESGELRVEALDAEGRVIPHFSRQECMPVHSNNTLQRIQWKGTRTLESLAGKNVKFKFYLRHGSLYSFWVSASDSGASQGFVAAGGPGFTSTRDTAGAHVYANCCAIRTNN